MSENSFQRLQRLHTAYILHSQALYMYVCIEQFVTWCDNPATSFFCFFSFQMVFGMAFLVSFYFSHGVSIALLLVCHFTWCSCHALSMDDHTCSYAMTGAHRHGVMLCVLGRNYPQKKMLWSTDLLPKLVSSQSSSVPPWLYVCTPNMTRGGAICNLSVTFASS